MGEMVSRLDEGDAFVDILKPEMLDRQPLDDKSRRKSDLVRRQQYTFIRDGQEPEPSKNEPNQNLGFTTNIIEP